MSIKWELVGRAEDDDSEVLADTYRAALPDGGWLYRLVWGLEGDKGMSMVYVPPVRREE